MHNFSTNSKYKYAFVVVLTFNMVLIMNNNNNAKKTKNVLKEPWNGSYKSKEIEKAILGC